MTAVVAENGTDNRTPWSRRGVRRLSGRTSLRTKLVTALLALVFVALTAMGIAGVALLRGYVIGPLTGELQGVASSFRFSIHDCVQAFVLEGDNSRCPPGTAVSWIPSVGTPVNVVTPASSYSNVPLPSPNLSGATSWITNNLGRPATVPAASGPGKWRVMGFADVIQNATGPSINGTVVIGVDATSAYNTLRQLTGVDFIVSVVILLVLAVVGFAVVQANLRPLVDIEETAGEIAEGHLNRRVPERDPRTEIGSLGRSLNTMLTQIESAFHDREQSEAAAHQSEERMRRFIADASHELRTPLTAMRFRRVLPPARRPGPAVGRERGGPPGHVQRRSHPR